MHITKIVGNEHWAGISVRKCAQRKWQHDYIMIVLKIMQHKEPKILSRLWVRARSFACICVTSNDSPYLHINAHLSYSVMDFAAQLPDKYDKIIWQWNERRMATRLQLSRQAEIPFRTLSTKNYARQTSFMHCIEAFWVRALCFYSMENYFELFQWKLLSRWHIDFSAKFEQFMEMSQHFAHSNWMEKKTI